MTTPKPLVAIFGTTGNQGHSAALHILRDPVLSQRYAVRALARTTTDPKLSSLSALGASLMAADMDDAASLPAALDGVDTLFFLTATQYSGDTAAIETAQAKNVCKAALEAGVRYIIYSSMPSPSSISGGKYPNVAHFESKARIETYIRSLDVQSAFIAPASFMQNLTTPSMRPVPSREGDGTFVLPNCAFGHSRMPFVDVTEVGVWVAAILAQPERFAGVKVAAAAEVLSMDEVAEVVGRVAGKTVRHQYVPDEVFKGFLPEGLREGLYEMWAYSRDFGYYGETMEEDVKWAVENARGEVTGLEAFLRRCEFKLE